MTVVSLVDRLIEEIWVPVDSNDPFLGRFDSLRSSSTVLKCTLRKENGYSGEHRVAEERA
jgi:hypothetical protein